MILYSSIYILCVCQYKLCFFVTHFCFGGAWPWEVICSSDPGLTHPSRYSSEQRVYSRELCFEAADISLLSFDRQSLN